jgi:hypothetical protein
VVPAGDVAGVWHPGRVNRVAKDGRGGRQRAQEASSRELRRVRLSDERYRPRSRRTSAEPLSATWKPEPPTTRKSGPRRDGGLKHATSIYGWRIYVVPFFLVATVLVVINTTRQPPQNTTGASQPAAAGTGSDSSAVVSERPPAPVNLNIPTADLPQGGVFTENARGSWHVIPLAKSGNGGKKAGTGRHLYRYTVEVEDGIDPSSYAGDDAFALAVEGILSDPRSWIGAGDISVQRVDASAPSPDFRVRLTSMNSATRPDLCGFGIQYPTSCYIKGFQRSVIINLARWVRGAKAFGPDMTGYREYAINHEVGHALGLGHVGCKENGGPAPVMMQQTFGVSNDYVAQLNSVDQYNKTAVPADGKVCKPNSWPVPALGDLTPG